MKQRVVIQLETARHCECADALFDSPPLRQKDKTFRELWPKDHFHDPAPPRRAFSFHPSSSGNQPPVATAAWSVKPRPIFSDAPAVVRRALWREQGLESS